MDKGRDAVRRALHAGARRSLEACSLPADDPYLVVLWRRRKWTIIAVGMFVLIEVVLLGGLGGKMGRHF